MRVVVLLIATVLLGMPTSEISAQRAFPTVATIRGENIWLRVDPAEETAIVAYLQRGDQVRVTADATAADGDAFYPVEVVNTGETGWVRELAIEPRSLGSGDQPPVVAVDVPDAGGGPTENEQPRRNRNRRAREAAGAVVAEAPAPANDRSTNVNPPAASGAGDRNCEDFSTQAEAQAFFVSQGGPNADPHDLDRDRDGVACQNLP